MAYNIPLLPPEQKLGFPTFLWQDLTDQREISCGGFGAVWRANYRNEEVAVKELLSQEDEYNKKLFIKE